MPHPDAVEWNTRYQTDPLRRTPGEPYQLLTAHTRLLSKPGQAVDMACGLCTNGIYLASLGWRVTGLDVAEHALRSAQAEARKRQLNVSFAVLDLADPWLPDDSFDTILNFYFLSRPLIERYQSSLRPGGLLFFETFVWQPGIEMRPEHYLQPGELKGRFLDWEILLYEENDWSRHSSKQRRVARLIARRPGKTG